MARSIVSAIFLIAIFSSQARSEATEGNITRSLNDYRVAVSLENAIFANETEAAKKLLFTLNENIGNNITNELSQTWLPIYQEILQLISNHTDVSRARNEFEQLEVVSNDKQRSFRNVIVQLNYCFHDVVQKTASERVLSIEEGIKLIEWFEESLKDRCRKIVHPGVNCQFIDDDGTKNLFENYKSFISQRKQTRDILVRVATTCSEFVQETWPSKVAELKNRLITIRNRLQ